MPQRCRLLSCSEMTSISPPSWPMGYASRRLLDQPPTILLLVVHYHIQRIQSSSWRPSVLIHYHSDRSYYQTPWSYGWACPMMLARPRGRALMGESGSFCTLSRLRMIYWQWHRVELHPGDYVTVSASRYPFAYVLPPGRRSEDWVHSISKTLNWNSRQRQKGFKWLPFPLTAYCAIMSDDNNNNLEDVYELYGFRIFT